MVALVEAKERRLQWELEAVGKNVTRFQPGDEVFGHPIGRPAAYLHRVGALIEAPAFYPALTGEANLTELTAGRRRAGTALPRHHRRLRHDGPYPPDRRTGPSHRIRSCPDRPPHRRLRRDRGLDPHARR